MSVLTRLESEGWKGCIVVPRQPSLPFWSILQGGLVGQGIDVDGMDLQCPAGVRKRPDNQDYTLRFRRDAHGSTFPCFFKILFFKGFSKSYDKFTTQMYLGVICTGPYAHGSTFQTTNKTTCTRSPHTISRSVHMIMYSTYFVSHISPWSRCHLLAGNKADHCTVARLHFFSKRFGFPV